MQEQRRIVTRNWDLYDTRHVVFRPARLKPEALKEGYDRAYREFYRWSSIARASRSHGTVKHQAKHFFYASGWKKFEPLWNFVIRARQLGCMTPLLEAVLSKVSRSESEAAPCTSPDEIRIPLAEFVKPVGRIDLRELSQRESGQSGRDTLER
jgi:hypothetical protein